MLTWAFGSMFLNGWVCKGGMHFAFLEEMRIHSFTGPTSCFKHAFHQEKPCILPFKNISQFDTADSERAQKICSLAATSKELWSVSCSSCLNFVLPEFREQRLEGFSGLSTSSSKTLGRIVYAYGLPGVHVRSLTVHGQRELGNWWNRAVALEMCPSCPVLSRVRLPTPVRLSPHSFSSPYPPVSRPTPLAATHPPRRHPPSSL